MIIHGIFNNLESSLEQSILLIHNIASPPRNPREYLFALLHKITINEILFDMFTQFSEISS